jgi:hypothetical protein
LAIASTPVSAEHPDANPGGLGHAPHVDPGDQGEHREAQPDPGAVQRGEGGPERGDPGGHADGRVEDVVDDQRGGGDQARLPAEMPGRDRVRAAAAREGRDHLAIREDQDREQDGDGDRHRQREVQGRGPGRGQDDHDRLRPVGHRGQRVEREGGQALECRQPMPFFPVLARPHGHDGHESM